MNCASRPPLWRRSQAGVQPRIERTAGAAARRLELEEVGGTVRSDFVPAMLHATLRATPGEFAKSPDRGDERARRAKPLFLGYRSRVRRAGRLRQPIQVPTTAAVRGCNAQPFTCGLLFGPVQLQTSAWLPLGDTARMMT